MPITPLPTPPTRNDPTTFADRGDALLGALPSFVTEANALEASVEADKDAAASSATAAAGSATTALGHANTALAHSNTAFGHANNAAASANFRGAWSSLTGALAKPASVSHNGVVWLLLNDLGNVATSEPGVSADWQRLMTVHYQEFLSSGTWSKPLGVQFVFFEIVSGGGSGSAITSSTSAATSGGMGGNCVRAFLPASFFSTSESVVVGAGGIGPTATNTQFLNGIAGGASSFGSISVLGGKGASASTSIPPVSIFNGTAFGGDNITGSIFGGGRGGSGTGASVPGGTSIFAGGGGEGTQAFLAGQLTASNGVVPGGGGGGVRNTNTGGTAKAGNGASGRVRVWAW